MTRKHFNGIAAAVKAARIEAADCRMGHPRGVTIAASPVAIVDQLARDLADVCARDNGAFDRARFLRACGLEV